MGILVTWLVTTIAFFVASKLLDGMKVKGGLGSHLLIAAIFGVLNALIGPVLYLALGVVTLGLAFLLSFVAHLIVSAVVLKVVDALSSRLSVKDFKTAFLAAVIMSVTASVCEAILR